MEAIASTVLMYHLPGNQDCCSRRNSILLLPSPWPSGERDPETTAASTLARQLP